MQTENVVVMRGDLDRIFALACATEDWPRILPHYREVRVLNCSPDGRRKIVEMAAWRKDFPFPGAAFPTRWRSVQVCVPEKNEIHFVHIGGVAQGMTVVWTLTPDPASAAVRVAIRHDLEYPLRFLNGWFARDLVGHTFIESIAGRTLATIKGIVESEID